MHRLSRILLPPLLALAASPLLAPAAIAQKVPDVRIDTNRPGAAYSIWVRIASSGDAVYAAWLDSRNGIGLIKDVYFNRSLDAGRTWLPSDIRLDTGDPPGASDSFACDIAASGSFVCVVWRDDRSGDSDIYFNRSLDAGATWMPTDIRIDHAPGPTSVILPDIAVVGSTVYVVWDDWRNGLSDIYFNRSLDSGTTWMPQDIRLNVGTLPGFGRGDNPRIAASGNSVYVAWEDWRGGGGSIPGNIYCNRSLDRGRTWLPFDIRLNSASVAAFDARIAAAGSNVYVTWTDGRNGYWVTNADIYFNRSVDSGGSWLTPDVRLDAGTPPGQSNSQRPDIACSVTSVYVVWEDDRNDCCGTTDIYFNRSLDAGGTWLAQEIRLDLGDPPGASVSSVPKVTTWGSEVFVSWHDFRAGNNDVYSNRSPDSGTTWLPADVRLNTGIPPGTANSQNTAITASGSSAYVAWEDTRNHWLNKDIYFNIPLGIQPYGAGKAGSGGIVPSLVGSGFPVLGGSISIDVGQGLGGATGSLLAGLTGPASIPMLGGVLLVQPPLIVVPVTLGGAPGAPGAGSVSVPLSIPNNPGLVGLPLNFQALIPDPGAGASLVSMTNGVEVWLG